MRGTHEYEDSQIDLRFGDGTNLKALTTRELQKFPKTVFQERRLLDAHGVHRRLIASNEELEREFWLHKIVCQEKLKVPVVRVGSEFHLAERSGTGYKAMGFHELGLPQRLLDNVQGGLDNTMTRTQSRFFSICFNPFKKRQVKLFSPQEARDKDLALTMRALRDSQSPILEFQTSCLLVCGNAQRAVETLGRLVKIAEGVPFKAYLALEMNSVVQDRQVLRDKCPVLIGTATKLTTLITQGLLKLAQLKSLIVEDLELLSPEARRKLQQLLPVLNPKCQVVILSSGKISKLEKQQLKGKIGQHKI